MKKLISIGIAILIVLGIVYVFWHNRVEAPVSQTTALKQYISREYGVSFEYPGGYNVEEKNIKQAGTRFYYQVILTDGVMGDKPMDGPANISMEIFGNTLEKQSAEKFVLNSDYSNFNLSNKKLETKTYGTMGGVQYTHDGLYATSAFVTATDKYIFKFSVSIDDKKMVSDYENILKTVRIQ